MGFFFCHNEAFSSRTLFTTESEPGLNVVDRSSETQPSWMGGSSCPLGLFCTQKARIIVLTWYRQLVHPAHPPVTTRVTLLVANRVAGPCTTSRRSVVKRATGVRKIDKYTTKRHPCLPISITLQINFETKICLHLRRPSAVYFHRTAEALRRQPQGPLEQVR